MRALVPIVIVGVTQRYYRVQRVRSVGVVVVDGFYSLDARVKKKKNTRNDIKILNGELCAPRDVQRFHLYVLLFQGRIQGGGRGRLPPLSLGTCVPTTKINRTKTKT